MAYQTPDSKKEEFRKYLEKSGVIDALTKVLVGLYEEPERPPNAVDYIKRYMGAPTGIDVDALRQENEDLKFYDSPAVLSRKIHDALGRRRSGARGVAVGGSDSGGESGARGVAVGGETRAVRRRGARCGGRERRRRARRRRLKHD